MFNPYGVSDTTVLIWDYRYECRVPSVNIITEAELDICGHYTTGDKEIDKMMMTDLRHVWLSIDEMVEYYRNGVVVRVFSDSDIKLIYESISAHLLRWVERVKTCINVNTAPLNDLILMDRFASEIYEKAKYHISGDLVECFMTKAMRDISSFSVSEFYHPAFKNKIDYMEKNNIRGDTDLKDINIPVVPVEFAEREDLSTYFKRYLGFRQFY